MYGAVLVPSTEHTRAGLADVGVLFMHNEGWSTMCGHATIALGRYWIDYMDGGAISSWEGKHSNEAAEATKTLRLHAPCGIVEVTVPVLRHGDRWISNVKKPVSFVSVPSWACAVNVDIPISQVLKWPELADRDSVTIDICFGGAFYACTTLTELGFENSFSNGIDPSKLDLATRNLKSAINSDPRAKEWFMHEDAELRFLYGIVVQDTSTTIQSITSTSSNPILGAEKAVCYFADQQVDRSPTGSAVSARVALAIAKNERELHDRWEYHGLLADRAGKDGLFVGQGIEKTRVGIGEGREVDAVKVRVEGFAYYIGSCSFVLEESDGIGAEGFTVGDLFDPAEILS